MSTNSRTPRIRIELPTDDYFVVRIQPEGRVAADGRLMPFSSATAFAEQFNRIFEGKAKWCEVMAADVSASV